MAPLIIDEEDIIIALENHEMLVHYFLDLQSGEILFFSEELSEGDEAGQFEEHPERYLSIEPIPSSAGYEIMQDFVDTLPRDGVQARLTLALEQRRPFRHFKDVLLNYPLLRENWFHFHKQAMIKLAKNWLKAAGVEAEVRRHEQDRGTR